MKKKKWINILLVILLALPVCAMIGPIISIVEQPNYELISSEVNIEKNNIKITGSAKYAFHNLHGRFL